MFIFISIKHYIKNMYVAMELYSRAVLEKPKAYNTSTSSATQLEFGTQIIHFVFLHQ